MIDSDGLRPTSDRMKETIFNWLSPYIEGSYCLDLFAGSGSLGIEALSRGAAGVDFIELNKRAAANILDNLINLNFIEKAHIYQLSALDFINNYLINNAENKSRIYDIIWIDPPFALNLQQNTLDIIAGLFLDNKLIHKDSLIIIESPQINFKLKLPSYFSGSKSKSTRYSNIQLIRIF
ncbi:16S rRNA m(2)G966 methyltransferase [Gammaproteobacteria bacterium]|nr:16S rRNA m(2)G966 methyltransferase [Gammaproteobacteria bacterium]